MRHQEAVFNNHKNKYAIPYINNTTTILNQYLLNIKGNSVVEQTLRETPQDNRLIDHTALSESVFEVL